MADYTPVFRNSPDLERLQHASTLPPFGATVTGFVEAFSKELLNRPESRAYPDLAAVAFWMRRANLQRLRAQALPEDRCFLPRGTAFHIAPANVDTIFVYSWFLSLLCGNRNIVRISSSDSPQVALMLSVMQQLFAQKEFAPLAERSLVVRYGHDEAVNRRFSAACDIRVIWGGDATVRAVRQLPLPPTACEMTFANKYSLCVIDAGTWLQAAPETQAAWLRDFYNDAYWFAQMACSSPRLVLWLSSSLAEVEAARTVFWSGLERRVRQSAPELAMADFVNKRVAADSIAMATAATIPASGHNSLNRVWLEQPGLFNDEHCGTGLFLESRIESLDALCPLLSRRVQTVTHIGVAPATWRQWLLESSAPGIDRVVPVGRALEFQPVWDGYDLLRMFMREVTLA